MNRLEMPQGQIASNGPVLKTIGVVGAGPAGAYLARALARAGLEVDIFDHSHPREKPCGGVISTEVLHYMPEAEQLPSANQLSHLSVCTPFGHRFEQKLLHRTLAINRRDLDGSLLAGAVRAGACHIRQRVVGVELVHPKPRLQTHLGSHIYDLIVGADGVRSIVASAAAMTAKPHHLGYMQGGWGPPVGTRGTLVIQFGAQLGYAWVANRSDKASIGIVSRHEDVEQSRAAFHVFLEELGIPLRSLRPYRWEIPFSNDVFALAEPRCGPGWLLVGDAGGFCDPLTAKGIHLALASARSAAAAILSGDPSSYESHWRDLFGANLYFGVRNRDLLGSRPITEMMLRSLEINPAFCQNFAKIF